MAALVVVVMEVVIIAAAVVMVVIASLKAETRRLESHKSGRLPGGASSDRKKSLLPKGYTAAVTE